jgi:hypothetical protein
VASSTASIAMAAMATTRAMDLRGIYFAYLSFLYTLLNTNLPRKYDLGKSARETGCLYSRVAEKGCSRKPCQAPVL